MGIILVLASNIALALAAYYGKIALNISNMSGAINSFIRFFVGFIGMGLYIIITRKSFKAKDMKPIINRAICNSIAMLLFFMSAKYTTLTNANMLYSTYPIFVIVFAPLITREKVDNKTYLYLAMVMIGSYIVADPSFNSINKGDLMAGVSSLVAAFSLLNLTLARKENEGYIIVFYVMFIGTIINLPFAFNDIINFEMNALTPVLLSGICGFLGQILLTWGYKYVDSATGALVSSSQIIIGGLIGYFLLDEAMNTRGVIGMLLITLALIGASGYFDKKIEKTNI